MELLPSIGRVKQKINFWEQAPWNFPLFIRVWTAVMSNHTHTTSTTRSTDGWKNWWRHCTQIMIGSGLWGQQGKINWLISYFLNPLSELSSLEEEQPISVEGVPGSQEESVWIGFGVSGRTIAFYTVLPPLWWHFNSIPLSSFVLHPIGIFCKFILNRSCCPWICAISQFISIARFSNMWLFLEPTETESVLSHWGSWRVG